MLRLFGKFPLQLVLYAVEVPLRMEAALRSPSLQYSYRLIDIRELNGERLLESPRIGDNIVAILTRLPDARAAVHRVVERIAGLEPGEREAAMGRLLILAGLRKLGHVVEEEARKMPILNDILDHEVLGREYRKGLQEGVQQGVQQGEVTLLRRLIEKRFGVIPSWAEERLQRLAPTGLENLGVRVLEVNTIEELFQ